MHILQAILDWSEVWGPAIPLFVLVKYNKQPSYLKPVIVYVVLAFMINLFADIISLHVFPETYPTLFQENTYLYNLHSIVRFASFCTFFIMLKQPFLKTFKIAVPLIFVIFSIVYFSFEKFANPYHISADYLSTEAFLLLILCLLYYLYKLRDEIDQRLSSPDFYVVTGLSIYVVVNFFVFLFYVPMIVEDRKLADSMWNIHNWGYIVFCILLAKAFTNSYAD